MRVHELASELKTTSRDLIATLRDAGIEVKNHMSSLDEAQVAGMRRQYAELMSEAGYGPPPPPAPPVGIAGHENPLLTVWETEFGVPPFDQIQNDHYLPAFREAMEIHRAEIDAIVDYLYTL